MYTFVYRTRFEEAKPKSDKIKRTPFPLLLSPACYTNLCLRTEVSRLQKCASFSATLHNVRLSPPPPPSLFLSTASPWHLPLRKNMADNGKHFRASCTEPQQSRQSHRCSLPTGCLSTYYSPLSTPPLPTTRVPRL